MSAGSFFKNLGHYAYFVIHDISKFGHLALKAEPFVEPALEAVFPPAIVIDKLAHAALGYLVDAADKASAVADGKTTVSVELLKQEIDDLKSLAQFFKTHAVANSVKLPGAAQ